MMETKESINLYSQSLTPTTALPVADAGSDSFGIDADLDGEKLIVLDASGSTDDDGTIVSYAWFVDKTLIGTEVEINQAFFH